MVYYTGKLIDPELGHSFSAQIAVFLEGTLTPATLQNVVGNIVVADGGGNFFIDAAAAGYDLHIFAFGQVVIETITICDAAGAPPPPALLAAKWWYSTDDLDYDVGESIPFDDVWLNKANPGVDDLTFRASGARLDVGIDGKLYVKQSSTAYAHNLAITSLVSNSVMTFVTHLHLDAAENVRSSSGNGYVQVLGRDLSYNVADDWAITLASIGPYTTDAPVRLWVTFDPYNATNTLITIEQSGNVGTNDVAAQGVLVSRIQIGGLTSPSFAFNYAAETIVWNQLITPTEKLEVDTYLDSQGWPS